MNVTVEQLMNMQVADVMTQDVVTIAANSTMAEAAAVLSQHDISGAPVVNEMQQCVGILSSTNFVRRDQSQDSSNTLATPAGEFKLEHDEGAGPYHIEHFAEDLVHQHMCHAPQTIDARRSLIDAAKYMVGEHVHRLIIVDEHGRTAGVISSLDILTTLVQFAGAGTNAPS